MIPAMRDVIVAANWKMNTTPADAGELARTIASRTREPGVIRVICPPFVCLAAVRDALAESDPDVAIGAQTVHHELAGAYTGEISAPMLAGLATWVIVGHSERRRDAGETDELIGRKLTRAVDAGLRPILCVGEQLAERDAGSQEAVVERQLAGALAADDPARLAAAGLVIAYEPVWAIGTGRNASGQDASAMADAIRAALVAAGLGAVAADGHPGPVRRQRHVRQHRGVPRGARDRWRARRRRLAEARRDGRDRVPRRSHRPRTPRRGVTVAPLGRPRPIVLVVLDGFGIGRDPAADAIAAAPMPTWRGLLARWPHATLGASEGDVGLPPGQMGNSEVGHLNLGAGRPVLQDLPRIDAAIADGSFFERPALLAACRRAVDGGGTLHLISLVGPGGVHANDRHLVALAELAARTGVARVRVHALLDGRDTPPSSALGFVADLERRLAPPTRTSRSPRSAAATTRWTATAAGTASSAATTRSSTPKASTPRRRPRPSRPHTPAARPTSSWHRPSSTARTARSATASRSSMPTSEPTGHASWRTPSRTARRSPGSTGPRPRAVRRRPACWSSR